MLIFLNTLKLPGVKFEYENSWKRNLFPGNDVMVLLLKVNVV